MAPKNDKYVSGEYYIAFIDILGFKNFICRNNFTNDELFNYLSDVMRPAYKEMKLGNQEILQQISYTILSDSIVLYISSSIPYAFFILLSQCFGFQKSMLYSKHHLLVRGGVVKGDLVIGQNNSIIFGKGLVDAYLLEKNTAKFPRIALTEKFYQEELKQINNYTLKEFLKRYVIVDFIDKFRYVSYGSLNDEKSDKTKVIEAYNFIKDRLDNETDISIKEKLLYVESHFSNRADIKKIVESI